jgi:bacteriocin resistance YdeI/OmpD-like protein
MSRTDAIHVSGVVKRKQADLPRFVVVPASAIERWRLAATATVEATINGAPVGRRSIQRWDDKRWFVSITERDCRSLDIDTGSRIDLVLRIASTELPEELAMLLKQNVRARNAWDSLTPSQQRMLREDIATAKQPSTRDRRARKVLLGE